MHMRLDKISFFIKSQTLTVPKQLMYEQALAQFLYADKCCHNKYQQSLQKDNSGHKKLKRQHIE